MTVINVHYCNLRGVQYLLNIIRLAKCGDKCENAIVLVKTHFKDHLTQFIIVYPIDSFQDHFTSFTQMVLKGVNWVHNDKIGSNGLESSQLGGKNKNQFIWS